MNDVILDKKIKRWEDQLLDLGKRNKMISFGERGTLKILKPDFPDLYKQIVIEEKELTFQKAIDRDSDIRVYSILSLLDKMSYPMEVNIGDIRAKGTLPEVNKTLRNLRAKSRLALDEQGTNILYLVFGFIEWHERGGKDAWIRSPLLLVPVSITMSSLNAPYTLKRYEDDLVVNPTLAYLFQRDYGITLPEFDPDKDSLDSFMNQMEEMVDERGWRIAREASIGLVSFLKISMYNDLIRNEEQLKQNKIIRAFSGELNEINQPHEEVANFDHDAKRAADSFLVMDADSSQQDAITLSQKGISFVMQGPPGTGKSQTITNIIAQGLADGKKILFVSEKMAALDVVYRRLTDVHLADFCLSLHSHKANKKDILNQLGNNLDLERRKVKDEEIAKLTQLDILKEKLNAYVHDIHTTVMPLEMSLYEVYGAILELADLPDINVAIEDPDKLTKDDVNRRAILISSFDSAKEALGPQWYKNPWRGVTCSYLEVSQKRTLQENLQEAIRVIDGLTNCKLDSSTLADVLTLNSLDKVIELCEFARQCGKVPSRWYERNIGQEESLVSKLQSGSREIADLRKKVSAEYDTDIFELKGSQCLDEFGHNYKQYKDLIYGREKDDDSVFEALAQDREKLSEIKTNLCKLSDAYQKMSTVYDLSLPYTFKAIENVLTVCTLMLQHRNFTEAYFGTDNLESLKSIVAQIRDLLFKSYTEKKRLCTDYAESILYIDCQYLYEQVRNAIDAIDGITRDGEADYQAVQRTIEFDAKRIDAIESAYSGDALNNAAKIYGVTVPKTIKGIDNCIAMLNLLPTVAGLHSWQDPEAREEAKQLLSVVTENESVLDSARSNLIAFIKRSDIRIDIDHVSADDLERLHKINVQIPEVAHIAQCIGNDKGDQILNDIDSEIAELRIAQNEVGIIRNRYGIISQISDGDFLSLLKDNKYSIQSCSPVAAWIDEDKQADNLLAVLIAKESALQEKHKQFAETYEESVFSIDCAAMLDRFKAEYTGVFKIFKKSYKDDVKQIRIAYKDVQKKITDEDIVALLKELRSYHKDLDEYMSLTTETERLLGIHSYDIFFDWNVIRSNLNTFRKFCAYFSNAQAAYQFICDAAWNEISKATLTANGCTEWFDNNKEATALLGALYKNDRTDTAAIREWIKNAENCNAMFTSTYAFVRFYEYAQYQDILNAIIPQVDNLINMRQWFADNSAEIKKTLGIDYCEGKNDWAPLNEKFDIYEKIVAMFGETTTNALVKASTAKDTAYTDYYDSLLAIASIKDCLKDIYRSDYLDGIEDTCAEDAIKKCQLTIAGANTIVSVYYQIAPYAAQDYRNISIEKLCADLKSLCEYHTAVQELAPVETVAKRQIGLDYDGVNTDWDIVNDNIAIAEEINTLLSGNITPKIISAFVDHDVVYTEDEIKKINEDVRAEKELEENYSSIKNKDAFEDKLNIIEVVLTPLSAAIDIAQSVKRCAYSLCPYSKFIQALTDLATYQAKQEAFSKDLGKAKLLMPFFGLDKDTDWDVMVNIFDSIRNIKRIINTSDINGEIAKWVTNSIDGVPADSYQEQLKTLERHKSDVLAVTGLFANEDEMRGYSLAKLASRFGRCNDQFATLDRWIDLRNCKQACEDNGLGEFIQEAEDAYYPQGTLKDVFMKGFYYEWFEKVCAGFDSVSGFRVHTQEDTVSAFRELDAHQLPVDQMRIREKLIREMPTRDTSGRAMDEMGLLLHELNKKRNVIPLRKLFRSIPHLLLKLKPCLMMSPLSVSYFLEAETYKFDMVIFDEASQIFPQDAIGAIFRGKQVIIAGDSKQLPPTNFFSASTNNDNDYDTEDEEEDIVYDSILEEASSNLLNRSLLWHYRSRYEELISFSNQEIYQNNLITFPSSTIQEKDCGVEYVYVENGVYENRCNRIEAQRIVQLVADHIKRNPDRSLGVIAFSESQQSVIEDEINKFRIRNPGYESFFNEDNDEPFFVKNLENVQGDERDTIIFSICYAKNEQGRMYMRFGPLGNQGGERRLNVAITRAKKNVKLVGSIMPDDIDLSKTKSDGVRMLRSYILFAMHGNAALAKNDKKNSRYDVDVFSVEVGEYLKSRGCNIKMNVGSSDYTIDIAVEHPNKPGHYIAGIECDGNSYFMARTVRDRERLRPTVLSQMGWNMYRVWSTEWIRNPEAEKARLMDFISDAFQHYGEKTGDHLAGGVQPQTIDAQITEDAPDEDEPNKDNPYDIKEYEEVNYRWIWSWERYNYSTIAKAIREVVKTEQPVHIDLIGRRLTDRVTAPIRATIIDVIRYHMDNELVIEEDFVRFVSFEDIEPRRSTSQERSIEYISIPEIAAAMERVLNGAYGIERSALCSEAAKIFGFERNGPKIKQRTNSAVEYLLMQKKITISDGKILLAEE